MSIRPLALLDLPQLYRFRDEVIGLATARILTRGNPLEAARLLAYINPARHLYSAVANGDGSALLGGIIHASDDAFARMLYLAPASRLDHPELPDLIDNLSAQAGAWGAFHVLAEVDENNAAFVPLRRAGFSVYAWQRMWDVSEVSAAGSGVEWKRAEAFHIPAIQSLYYQIVPPLLQLVEPTPQRANGFIYNDGMRCYISPLSGTSGIVLTPLIHPEATDVAAKLSSLIERLPSRGSRPVYVSVRSYQAWLEPVLADLGAKPGQRQAVMVKHLARLLKEEQTVPAVSSQVSVQPSRVSRIETEK